jgi:L-serine dehydratase
MRAARLFAAQLRERGLLAQVERIRIMLYGSLGATGKGHASDHAIMLGLEGYAPDTVNIDSIPARLADIRASKKLIVMGEHPIYFDEAEDLLFNFRENLPGHVNGMRFQALDAPLAVLDSKIYYSVGGGFVVSEQMLATGQAPQQDAALPLPFHSGNALLRHTRDQGCSIAQVMRRNERHWRNDAQIDAGLLAIWQTMQACIQRGCDTQGTLPGGLHVGRRAAALYDKLRHTEDAVDDPLRIVDWVTLFALAVNEENAAGGRVVTAPTNGAAGIVPAVLLYYQRFIPGATDAGIIDFLLTSGAIGLLYKENASISGAEVGCQGEVGVACSMAAAGLCAVLGGTPEQVENAAEIGMEHHLGLTCDPVKGLVQIPCIERNAMAAVQAIAAARLALQGDGAHHVSLDQVIKTMRETGADMMSKYKETSLGGLAVNIIEC